MTPTTPGNVADASFLLPKKKFRVMRKKKSRGVVVPKQELKFNKEIMCNSLIQYSESKGLTKEDL